MIQAKIISGGTKSERFNAAKDIIYKTLKLADSHAWEKIANHPDFYLLSAEETIGIEEIRNIEHQIYLKPFSYPYKIVLIENAKALTPAAQNAFLKTLEEPPAYCYIILCVERLSSLLSTVISRCQQIMLPLKVEINLNPQNEKETIKTIDLILKGDVDAKFSRAQEIAKDEESALQAMAEISLAGKRMLFSLLLKHNKTLGEEEIIFKTKLIKLLHNIIFYRRYLEANINPRFVLENLFLTC